MDKKEKYKVNWNIKKVKIAVTVPKKYTEIIRKAMWEAGAGEIGNYTNCSISSKCIGTFKANKNAKPFIGKKNQFKYVKEEIVDVICPIENVKMVIEKVRKNHPYEEPVIEIIPLLDENTFNI